MQENNTRTAAFREFIERSNSMSNVSTSPGQSSPSRGQGQAKGRLPKEIGDNFPGARLAEAKVRPAKEVKVRLLVGVP